MEESLAFAARLEQFIRGLGLEPPTLSQRGLGRDQIPVILKKVAKNPADADQMTKLVESLF